ncbi:MAG: rod shape-determining protein RodA [Bacteroidales bacterium]|nr:MAG: rod shape-determining protein RodA [Bacteroidales bacterium]
MQERNSTWGGLDWPTIFIYLALVFMGWINIYAAVYSDEHNSILDFTQRYGMQLVWIIFAFALALVILLIDRRVYFVFAYFFYGLALLSLIAALLFGRVVNGAHSWLQFGSVGIQPAEFTKFATILALAKLIGVFNFKILQPSSLLKISIIILLPAFIIILQNDTGSAMVYGALILLLYREGLPNWFMLFLLFMVILFILVIIASNAFILITLFCITILLYLIYGDKQKEAIIYAISTILFGLALYFTLKYLGYKISSTYIILFSMLIGTPLAIAYAFLRRIHFIYYLTIFLVVTTSFSLSVDYGYHKVLPIHQQKRINDLLGIEADPQGWGYNVNQSKIAIGSGGFSGKGFLGGTQTKFNFVPEQSTDFIFCTVGEEWGFIGSSVVLSLFLILILRLIMLAERQRESFARVYGYGVVSILFFHVAVNVGMTIGLFPVIGIPLPFFSYGGSSLWAFTILLFIFIKLDSSR